MIWSMPGRMFFTSFIDAKLCRTPSRKPAETAPVERPHAADHDDHEAQNQEVHPHMVVGAEDRRVHGTGETGDDRRYAEDDGESAVNINSQQSDRLPVGHAGPYHHAEGCELQEGEHRADHEDGEQEVDQPPSGVDDASRVEPYGDAEINHALGDIRRRLRDRIGAEHALDDFLEHNRQTEGNENLFCVRPLIEKADQAAFHDDADQQHERYRDED